ncbi:hypothetical protein SAMN02800694_0703 [Luteibacter sp. UNCMF331Sha3.1]|uniref:hypothetical protein n=1 Tax=Luteibacter sp. UNCMF331Sha3.1 TaxID=1502760 RepID=UPI0008D7E06F|nr:hypothetical protein [Luteibacter sp. UNCMF331Sha3.1]SEM33956.1 hypothetical protein SAMN02800694_0703 [Luteibacter sp. UNCMF331Sha3.1]
MDHRVPLTPRELAWAFGAFLLIALIALGANPFRDQTVGPFDLLLSQPGWGNQVSFADVRHAERSDVLDYYLPRWIQARQQLRAGHLPLWNPLPAGGEPGILNLASGELTPAFLIFAASPSAALGLLAAILFNLSFGATGVYAFVRRHGGMLASLFAGLTVMLCGFNAAWLYWPHLSTAIWIGWLLWGVDRAFRDGTRHAVPGVALPLSGLLIGGFPFVSFLGIGAALLYVLCGTLIDRLWCRRAGFARCSLGLLAAIGLSFPGLLGFAEWLRDFELGGRVTGTELSYSDIAQLLPHTARQVRAVESGMYVGIVAPTLALLVIVIAAVAVIRRRWPSVLTVFSLALLAVSAVLVFGLVPRGLLAWIPGLANNRWNRAACLLDLSIALAAAACILYLQARVRKALVVPFVLALTLVQAIDLASYFRLLNGPMPTAAFYPRVPLIDRIAATSGPFQSTVADDSFLVSGSLGVYGIAEWFGHGFRTEGLKALLQEAASGSLTTATASRVAGSGFHFASPVFSALGVRYAVGGECLVSSSTGLPPDAARVARVALPPMPANTLVQTSVIARPALVEGVSFNLATYGRAMQHGVLRVVLTKPGLDAPLAAWNVAAADIVDNQVRTFSLPAPLALDAGNYLLTLKYLGAEADDKLTVWSFPGQWSGCSAGIAGGPAEGCMDFGFRVRRTDLGTFQPVASDAGIVLLENNDVPAGPYFLGSLTDLPHASSGAPIALDPTGPLGFSLHYSGSSSGFVVVPMSMRSGWHVTSGGKPVRPQRYLGVMPAIPVDGPADIAFRYRPLAVLIGVPIALLSALSLVFAAWIARKRTRPPKPVVRY